MSYEPSFRSPEQDAVLARLLAVAAGAAPGGLALLDVDGCLFDTRWRQVHIFRAFGALHGVDALTATAPEHFVDRDLARTMRATGVDPDRAAALLPDLRTFWLERFFDAAHCELDCPMPGAVRFVRELGAAGLGIVYLTGREAWMRPATERAFVRHGLPLGAGGGTLLTKPDAALSDHAWKAVAVEQVRALGEVVVALDNEPENLDLFADAFPGSVRVWVHTDHSSTWRRGPCDRVLRGFLRSR